jgi:hypothetical protein
VKIFKIHLFYLVGINDSEIKEESLVPNIIYTRPILSLPEVRVSIPTNPEEHILYLGSSHIISSIYSSGCSEGSSTSSQFPYEYDYSSISRYPSPFDYLACLHYYIPKEIKDLVQ